MADINIQDLPPEILLSVFRQVNVQDLKFISCVNRYFHSLVNSEPLFRNLCLEHTNSQYKKRVENDRKDGKTWQETYKMNTGNTAIHRDWIEGRFSSCKNFSELPSRVLCSLDAESWGKIFEEELTRS